MRGGQRDEVLIAHGAAGLLATFNQAGVLGVADVHTAQTVSRIDVSGNQRVDRGTIQEAINAHLWDEQTGQVLATRSVANGADG